MNFVQLFERIPAIWLRNIVEIIFNGYTFPGFPTSHRDSVVLQTGLKQLNFELQSKILVFHSAAIETDTKGKHVFNRGDILKATFSPHAEQLQYKNNFQLWKLPKLDGSLVKS